MPTLPLQGVRVLDLSRVLAGPFCAMTLGDLGAGVIKVERPGTGDDTRGWGPPFDDQKQSAYFLSTNRNKLSIAADFADSADRSLILDLIRGADVVIDNFLPGVLARYGFDKAALLARHRQLIWCTIAGFPGSSRPGYDFVVQAESGWMSITGPVDGSPFKVGVALVDVMAGKDAATAILAALAGRDRGLEVERSLEVTLAGSAAAALINVAQNTLVTGEDARRWGNAHPNLVPYQLFDAADRPIVVAVGSDAQWLSLVSVLELPDLAADLGLRTNAGRLAARHLIVARIAAALVARDAVEWISLLDAGRVPCGLVRSVQEALADTDASPSTGIPPAAGGTIRLRPPVLDEHGEQIRKMQWSALDHVPILVRSGV